MRTELEKGKLIAYLEGRIDSTNAADLQKELNEVLAAHAGQTLEIDAGTLTYISSAGLRVLLQVRKTLDRPLTVRNVSPEVYEILEMTGFTDLLEVKKRLREMSVAGCEIIGRGAIGTVYRVDPDTIVKVYEIPDSLPMIENEQKRAKQAFLKGIPTAISYDVVKVGDKYGSVFELLRASTYNDLIIAHPEKQEEIIGQYARFIRQLHAVEMDKGELPEAKAVFLGYLEALQSLLPEGLHRRLYDLFTAMPENLHVVHGDIQMKNVMLSGEEPLLIDMDTLSVGDPVFDLMSLHMTYVQFNEGDPDNSMQFYGISEAVAGAIWQGVLRHYFEGLDAQALEAKEKRIITVSLVRFLYLIAVLGIGRPELKQPRIDRSLARLEQLAFQVDALTVS